MRFFKGTAAERATSDKTAEAGDLVVESDTGYIAVADGSTPLGDLQRLTRVDEVPLLDVDGKVPEEHVPTRLGAAALTASFAARNGGIVVAPAPSGGDDCAALQALADGLEAFGGGTLQLQSGTYLIQSAIFNLPVNVDLIGVSKRATVVKMANAANLDAVVQTKGFASLTLINTSAGMTKNKVADLTVDGNKTNNTSGVGVRLIGWAYNVSHLRVQNCKGDGLYTEWGADRSGSGEDTLMESQFFDIESCNNDGNGWTYYGPHDGRIVGVVCKQNVGWGFISDYSAGQYNGAGIHLWNLNCWNNDAGGAWFKNSVTGHDVACSAGTTKTAIKLGSGGPCVLTAVTAGGAGIGLEVIGQGHVIQGIVPNCVIGVKINGAAMCVLELHTTNNTTHFNFATDNGSNTIIATSSIGVGSTPQTGTISASDTIIWRYDGNSVGNVFQILPTNITATGNVKGTTHLLAGNNVYAAHNTASQSLFGSAGPGGQMGLQLISDVNLYRSGADVLQTDDKFVTKGLAMSYAAKTAAYTVTALDYTVNGDATGGAFNVTLPTSVGRVGQVFVVRKSDVSGNAVTVNTTSSQTINGASTYALTAQYQAVRVQSDGANWMVV